MNMNAIAPWFGGKRNIAPKIIELLGQHRSYWELFCGSMAVLLTKPVCTMETAVDLHGDLTNLAKVVQDEKLSLILFERLNRTLMSETLHREAATRYRDRGYHSCDESPNVDYAYDYFLCAWIGRNGVAGTQSYNQGFCARYTSNGGHAAKRWQSAIASIPDWHYRLMNVTILRRDVFDVIDRIEDKSGTVIYADPPYLVKGCKYVHDFADGDHERLATALHRFRKTRVVLSYYDHPDLNKLYPRWRQHKINVIKAIAHQGKRGTNDTRAVEVLLVNG